MNPSSKIALLQPIILTFSFPREYTRLQKKLQFVPRSGCLSSRSRDLFLLTTPYTKRSDFLTLELAATSGRDYRKLATLLRRSPLSIISWMDLPPFMMVVGLPVSSSSKSPNSQKFIRSCLRCDQK